jgi:PAS domain S-box-containing protein
MMTTRLKIVERLASGITVLVAAAMWLGWVLGLPALQSVLHGMPATALCFILSGAAVWIGNSDAKTRKARSVAMVCSVTVLLAGALTLVQYLFGWHQGLDKLFQGAVTAGASSPWRMSPNTAVAFVLLNTALLLLPNGPSRARGDAMSLLGALTALLGLFAVKLGYGWGDPTTMALLSNSLFLLLGSTCAARAWTHAGMPLVIGRRLLAGFGIGLVVFVVSSIPSYQSARQVAETLDWVGHTQEVLEKLQKVISDLIGTQAAVRGFVITGQDDFLAPYYALRELQDDEQTLRRLSADNPRQQQRLTTLEVLIRQWRASSEEILALQRHHGFAAADASISGGSRREIWEKIGLLTGALEHEEQELLTERESRARAQTARTFFILPIGTFVGLGVLVAVLFLLNSEATERLEAEAASRLAAEIVKSTDDAIITKTLEGIITSWNPGAERIFGYTAQEAVGQSVLMLVPPECADEEKEILAKTRQGERVQHIETVRVGKDGRRANVSLTISPIKDNAGVIVGASKILRDITERKQVEEALRGSEERFRTMANSITQLAWIARADGFIYWYNERWYEYTGTTPESVEGWGWQIVYDPEALPNVVQNWTRAIASGQPFEMESLLRSADGKFRTFLTRVHPFKDAEGRVVQWFGTNTDVDQLKRVEESLRAAQARLNSTLASGSIGTWSWDIVNDRLVADEFTARMYSIKPDEASKGLPAQVYLQAVMQEDQPGVALSLARAIESCGQYDMEYRVPQKDGQLVWLQAKGQVEGDAAGKALNFYGAVIDITERKRMDQALRDSEEHFRFLNDLFEAMRTLNDPEDILAVTARMLGKHLGASRCAYVDVGPDGEQFTIRYDYTDGCASTVGNYRLSLLGARAVATLHNGQTLIIRNVESELSPGEGAEMFNALGIKAIIACPLVKDGGLCAMMAVNQTSPREWTTDEITVVQLVVDRCWAEIERRAAAESIRRSNAELERRVVERTALLEAANRELEAFSYSVSHDLRAPLRAVDGFSQAVVEDYGQRLPEEGLRFLNEIRQGAQRMGTLIDDLLAFARFGRQTMNKREVDMERLVRGVIESLASQREGRQVAIHIDVLPPCLGDPALLKQVWVNLLSNALKYTRKRERAVLEIGCAREKNEDVYFVRDNGTGFDMQFAGKLFGVFQRLHRAEDYEGTGVGLAIVQRVIHRHGGRVWAEGALERGATFYFTIPGETKS